MLKKGDVRLKFKHFGEQGREGTECYLKILVGTDEPRTEQEFIGRVKRFYKDIHDKDRARKYAIQSAIRLAELDKRERTVVWELYKEQKPGGRY